MAQTKSRFSWLRTRLGRLIMPIESKQSPFLWPAYQNGVVTWGMGNFLTYVNEGFNLNALIYAAIMYKVRAAAQVRLRAYTGDPDNPEPLPPNHPMHQLLTRPNPYQSFAELHGLIIAYLNLAGNAYLYVDREGAKNGVPAALYPLRPDRVWLIPGEGTIKGYLYRPPTMGMTEGVPILPEDLIHIKFPNLADEYEGMGYGLSPMSPLAQSADVDNNLTKFIKLFFERGGMPAGILKYNIPLELPQIQEIKQKWREIYGGVNNWTDVGVVDAAADYQQLGQNFGKLGLDVVDNRDETRIIGPFGVPPILIGAKYGLERSTFSNYEEARKAFWQDTMAYELRLELDSIGHFLATAAGAFVQWDMSQVPALKQNIQELATSAKQLFDMGVPAHMALAQVGLKIGEFESGDVSFLPAGLQQWGTEIGTSVSSQGQGTAEGDTRKRRRTPRIQKRSGSTGSDDEETHADPDRAEWAKAADKTAESHEEAYRKAATSCFEEDQRTISAIVGRHAKAALHLKATVDWKAADKDIKDYLATESKDTWRSKFTPLLSGTVSDAGDFWSIELGVSFDLRNLLAEEWFQDYTLTFADPISDTTYEGVQNVIASGMADGLSVSEMQDQLKTLFTGYADYRTERIARTETIRAYNAGSTALFKDWGLTDKEWSAADDARTRPTHAAADGQTVAVDDNFNIGGYEMGFPGDASHGAPPSEFVNCRCSILPAGDLAHAHDMGAEATADEMTPMEIATLEMGDRLQALDARYQPQVTKLQDEVGKPIAELRQKQQELFDKAKALEPERQDTFRARYAAEGDAKTKLDAELTKIVSKQQQYQLEASGLYDQINDLRNGKAARDAISFGTDADIKLTSMSGGQLKQKVKDAKSWLSSFLDGDVFDSVEAEANLVSGRAYHQGGSIFIGRNDGVDIVIHETAHGIEQDNPGILKATRDFLQYRAGQAGETTPSKLSILTGDKSYGDSEVAFADNFQSPYVGKFYGTSADKAYATEILSKGFEYMYKDPSDFYNTDPEYFNFIMSIAEGVW